MKDEQELRENYGYVIGDLGDPATLRLVRDLDALIGGAEPRQGFVASTEKALREQAGSGAFGAASSQGALRRWLMALTTARTQQARPRREHRSSPLARAFGIASLAVFVIFVLVAALWLTQVLQRMQVAQQMPAKKTDIAYAVIDLMTPHPSSEVIAFDGRTGSILRKIPAHYQPDVAVSANGRLLFLLDTKVSADYKRLSSTLSVIDTRSWKRLATVPMQDRFLYTVTGPSTMVLSPDGKHLFVYSSRFIRHDEADYWLSVFETPSLKVMPERISLPDCKGATFGAAKGQIVALCGEDVRFIAPNALKVVATVKIAKGGITSDAGRPVGLVVSRDQQRIYVVTNDLRIFVIDPSTHRVVRTETRWQMDDGSVPSLDSVAISPDGRYLMVGVLATPKDPESLLTLHRYELPSLTPAGTIPLRGYGRFATAPGGEETYIFPWVNGHKASPMRILRDSAGMSRSDLSRQGTVLKFGGQILRFVP